MLSQISFFTIINPINALIPSSMFTRKNIPTMCMAVNFVRHIATGTFTRQTKQLSNRNVIIVFPPLLKMKYSEFDSDINGVAAATAHINFVASSRKNTGLIGSFSGQGRLTLYNFCREIANIFRLLSCQFSPIPLNCCIEIFSVRGKIG